LGAGVRASPGDGGAPGRPALARDDHEPFFAKSPFGLEDESRNRIAVNPASADVAEVLRQGFLRRIQEQLPGHFLEYSRRLVPQRLQYQPHHHRAALDVVRARAVNAVAFGLPMEMVPRLFLGGKYRIEMRHHREAPPRAPWPRQKQVIAVVRICRWHKLRCETEWRETLRREAPQSIHAFAITCKRIDANHLAQHLQ